MARVAVIGAGVVGVASAYMLCRQGHDVTLVDRHGGPAEGASRANGAQLSYAYSDALASPQLVRHLPAVVLGRDPAFRVRLAADPEFLIWGLRFLANGRPARFLANTRFLIEMALSTAALLKDLLDEFDLAFDYRVAGKMILYPSRAAFEAGADIRRLKDGLGIRQEVLDRPAATAAEPALDLYPDAIDRVLHTPDDAVARPDRFCTALVGRLAAKYGLRTVFGHEVRGIASHGGRVAGLTFRAREPLACDIAVVASGGATGLLPAGDRPYAAIWPVQGYSITAPATDRAMRVSITDLRRKIVFARIGSEIRAAGLADIGGRDVRFSPERFRAFAAGAAAAFGGAFAHGSGDSLHPWSEARPCTPSSRPLIGRGSLDGLYLNLGHGTLGWTLSLGSARRLTDIITATR